MDNLLGQQLGIIVTELLQVVCTKRTFELAINSSKKSLQLSRYHVIITASTGTTGSAQAGREGSTGWNTDSRKIGEH